MQLPYFGEIDIDSLNNYYEARALIGQVEIQLDINFLETTTDIGTMDTIKKFIENIAAMKEENIKYYTEDFNKTGEADD